VKRAVPYSGAAPENTAAEGKVGGNIISISGEGKSKVLQESLNTTVLL